VIHLLFSLCLFCVLCLLAHIGAQAFDKPLEPKDVVDAAGFMVFSAWGSFVCTCALQHAPRFGLSTKLAWVRKVLGGTGVSALVALPASLATGSLGGAVRDLLIGRPGLWEKDSGHYAFSAMAFGWLVGAMATTLLTRAGHGRTRQMLDNLDLFGLGIVASTALEIALTKYPTASVPIIFFHSSWMTLVGGFFGGILYKLILKLPIGLENSRSIKDIPVGRYFNICLVAGLASAVIFYAIKFIATAVNSVTRDNQFLAHIANAIGHWLPSLVWPQLLWTTLLTGAFLVLLYGKRS
jgi:uncharacterized membrane protein YeiH